MQCSICKRAWPDEFIVCPICAVPFSMLIPPSDRAQGPVVTGTGSIGASGDIAIHEGGKLQTGGISADEIKAENVVDGNINYIVNVFGLAYQALREELPEDHPAIQWLRESLSGLAAHHEHINEWKELHNLLQELLNAIDPFLAEIQRLCDAYAPSEPKILRQWWRPCRRRIGMIVAFAQSVRYVDQEPYSEDNGTLHGPTWTVEIVLRQRQLEEILKEEACNTEEILELVVEFSDICHTHLYLADKNLREQVGSLYAISTSVLARVKE